MKEDPTVPKGGGVRRRSVRDGPTEAGTCQDDPLEEQQPEEDRSGFSPPEQTSHGAHILSPTPDCRGEVRLAGSAADAAEQQLALSLSVAGKPGGVTITLPQVASIVDALSRPLACVGVGRLVRDIISDARLLRPAEGERGRLSLWMTPTEELRLVFSCHGTSEEVAAVPAQEVSLTLLSEDPSGRSFVVVSGQDRFYFWATERELPAGQLRAIAEFFRRPPSLAGRTGVPEGVLRELAATLLSPAPSARGGSGGEEPEAGASPLLPALKTGGEEPAAAPAAPPPLPNTPVTFSATATALTRCHLSGYIASATCSVEATAEGAGSARRAAELGARREAELAARRRLEALVAEDAAQLRHKQRVLAARLEKMLRSQGEGAGCSVGGSSEFGGREGGLGGGVWPPSPPQIQSLVGGRRASGGAPPSQRRPPPGTKVDLGRLDELLGRGKRE